MGAQPRVKYGELMIGIGELILMDGLYGSRINGTQDFGAEHPKKAIYLVRTDAVISTISTRSYD